MQNSAAEASDSAAGPDPWGLVDLKKLSPLAYKLLARMLNKFDAGADWPEEMNEARAAFMAKVENDMFDPLAYRVLLMLPAVYMMWTRTRLAHLTPWIAEWATPEMYAGIEGQGAEEAAFSTALLLNNAE